MKKRVRHFDENSADLQVEASPSATQSETKPAAEAQGASSRTCRELGCTSRQLLECGFGGDDTQSESGFAGQFEALVVEFDFTDDVVSHAFGSGGVSAHVVRGPRDSEFVAASG